MVVVGSVWLLMLGVAGLVVLLLRRRTPRYSYPFDHLRHHHRQQRQQKQRHRQRQQYHGRRRSLLSSSSLSSSSSDSSSAAELATAEEEDLYDRRNDAEDLVEDSESDRDEEEDEEEEEGPQQQQKEENQEDDQWIAWFASWRQYRHNLASLSSILRCPRCDGRTEANSKTGSWKWDSEGVRCLACGVLFPLVHDGILDFYPSYGGAAGRSQRMMELSVIAAIYETIWRPLFTRLGSSIRYEEEEEFLRMQRPFKKMDVAIDIASGSGRFGRQMAREWKPRLVVCFDLSLPMLIQAQRKAAEEGLRNMVFIRGDVGNLPFRDDCFDFVNCFGALHLFPDTDRALHEIQRTLKRDAPFCCLTACALHKGDDDVASEREWLSSELSIPFLAKVALWKSDFRFFEKPKLTRQLAECGFRPPVTQNIGHVLLFTARATRAGGKETWKN